ncbi:MAG: ABC transporter ATP-binding protein [Holosporaceae bacterium]|jgi:ABC-type sugar transport system ATPase subunit|nr:ABC transporter ATP-binding protein [Holosporaceae bacterium]
MASITLKNVRKSYKDSEVIKGIDLTMEDGECTVLVGPSGCGKSTVLRLICGLEDIDDGEIHIGNRFVNDVPPASRGIAMVFQSYALYPHMTVFENMAFALQVRKLKKNEIEGRVINTAKILKIDHLLHRRPKELSGGQRQRVAIGRAIVRKPYAFLFDEPLSNLDSTLRCQMRYELAKLKAQLKTTMVYVTHDQSEAMTLADKIVVMRDGLIEQVGTAMQLYNSPANTFVARFIGSCRMNIFPVSFVEYKGSIPIFKMPNSEIIHGPVIDSTTFNRDHGYHIGIRPEDMDIVESGSTSEGKCVARNVLGGVVVVSENLGGEGYIHVSLKDGLMISLKAKKSISEKSGDTICFGFESNRCYLFDQNEKIISGIQELRRCDS